MRNRKSGGVMLKLINVSKFYHSGNNVVLALKRINMECKLGEFIAITGESGSGKSTLLNVLSGLDTYENGKILVDGKDLTYYTVDELERYRKDYIGFIFQDYNIIDSYTVYQNVELALTVQGIPKQERKQKILDILQKVGLTSVMHQKAAKLSGGEQQRTVIARTLAKDSKILVCDEPTGNLDSGSGKAILELLYEISKEKLVIVVTHDFASIEPYASRKIRLYDGEILEDIAYRKTPTINDQLLSPKTFKTTVQDLLKISLYNVKNVPKKSFFVTIILMFLLLVTFFTYGNGIAQQNRSYSFTTPYFENPDQSRIIVTKYNEEAFTPSELDEISNIEYVRTVFNNDAVFDTTLFNRTTDPVYGLERFYYFRILSAEALNEFDLIDGVLPTAKNEVVVSDRTQYVVGDWIGVSDTYLTLETSGMVTNQFTYKIVGVTKHNVRIDDNLHTLYFTDEALEEIAISSIYSNSETYVEVTGTTTYHTPSDTWITPDMDDTVYIRTTDYSLIDKILIDNLLPNFQIKTYDMMFYDICRDFGYKKEIVDDMDAGLCPSAGFLGSHSFRLAAITTFENEVIYQDIEFKSFSFLENDNDQHIYMNDITYKYFFGEKNYQVTAVVYDVYEGKQVVEQLNEMGYNVFYPSQIIGPDQSLTILLTNIRIMLVIILTLSGIFLVGYLVLKNIIMSKQKDYLIFRSIGTSKRSIRNIIQLEVFYLFLLSSILVVLGIYILEQFNTNIPVILRYIQFKDYLIIFTGVIFVLQLMIRGFGKKIFDVNLIATLKGLES